MKKLLSLIIILSFIFSIAGFALADEDKKLNITNEMVKGATEVRLEAIRSGHIGTAQFLSDEIDFWGEFIKRLLKTGTLIGIQKGNKMLGGFEVSFWETENVEAIFGVIPTTGQSSKFFWGLELKGIPLASDFAKIFKRFDPGIVFLDGKTYFSVSFVWQEKELTKRYPK